MQKILLGILVITSMQLYAQSRIQLIGFQLQNGTNMLTSAEIDQAILVNIARNPNDINFMYPSSSSGYHFYMHNYYYSLDYNISHLPNISFKAMAIFNVLDRKNGGYLTNREMRIGIGYSSWNKTVFQGNKEIISATSIDTSGIYTFEKDTTINYKQIMQLNNEDISLQLQYVFKSNEQRRFSFIGGLGLGLGVSLSNNITNTLSTETISELYIYENGSEISSETKSELSDHSTHRISVNTYSAIELYLPLAIQWRLSKKDNWLKGVYLNMGTDLGLKYLKFKDSPMYYARMNNGFVGIKWIN